MLNLTFLTAATVEVVESSNVAPTIVTALLVALAFGLAGYGFYRHFKKLDDPAAELEEFLSSIQEIVIANIIEAIKKLDFANKDSFADAQAELLNGLYDDIWVVVGEELDEIYGTENNLYNALRLILTKDKIKDYVDTLFSDDAIQDKLIELYNTAISKKEAEIVAEEEKAQIEADQYENDTVVTEEVPELDPTKLDGVGDNTELNPPVEEESETIVVDDTVEVIETVDVTDALVTPDEAE